MWLWLVIVVGVLVWHICGRASDGNQALNQLNQPQAGVWPGMG